METPRNAAQESPRKPMFPPIPSPRSVPPISPIRSESFNGTSQGSSSIQKNYPRVRVDIDLGFKIYDLSQRQANKVTRLMQSEFAKEIGPAGKRKERENRDSPKAEEIVPKAPDRRHKNLKPVPVPEDSDSDDGPPLPNGMIKTKVYKRYAQQIQKERERLDFIEKQSHARKKKGFELPIEITNFIMNCLREQMAKIEMQGSSPRESKQSYSFMPKLSSRTTREGLSPKGGGTQSNTQSIESLHVMRSPSFGFGLKHAQP